MCQPLIGPISVSLGLSPQAAGLIVTMTQVGYVIGLLFSFSANLAPDAVRGQVVGTVTSGLMIGIMMARPVASLITHLSAWPVVFYLSSGAIAGTAVVLVRSLPPRHSSTGLTYGALLGSMAQLTVSTPVLRRRASYQFCLFFAFSLFWTTVPLYLAVPTFGLTQAGIAWFGLAAVAGPWRPRWAAPWQTGV